MNYGLAKEIYGVPWCIDAVSYQSLSAILQNSRKGVVLEMPEVKYNSIDLLQIKGETRLIQRDWQLLNREEFDGIGILNLNGPITKGGGDSSSGMIELSSSMRSMAKDQRIKGFIILGDSGGGSTAAVRVMSDTINEVKQTKPVYTLIEKEGILGSAAYGIASSSNKIYAQDGMSIVGSLGTMLQVQAKKDNSVDKDGTKNIVIYATKSTEKNKPIREAINNDNFELILSEVIDPINENFLSKIIEDRPILKGTDYDNGHTVFSKDAVGTFIDGIASFDEVVDMVLSDSKNYNAGNKNEVKFKSDSKMTKEDLRSQHPTVYSEILSEGMTAEKERVASWMVYQSADPEAVASGIQSGEAITPSQREALMVKMNSKDAVEALKSDSAKDLGTGESKTEIKNENHAEKEIESAFDFKL